jgi:hypothetical protein
MARTTGSNKTRRPLPPTVLTDRALQKGTNERQVVGSDSPAVTRQRRATKDHMDRAVARSQELASARRRGTRGMY